MTMNMDGLDAETVERIAYFQRVDAVRQRFERLPHGSQHDASRTLAIASTTVSSVLRGRIVDANILSRLENWLDAYEPQPLTR